VHSTGNLPGDIAYFSCYQGLVIDGDWNAICQENGTWSNPKPKCKERKEEAITQGTLAPNVAPTTTQEPMIGGMEYQATTAPSWYSQPSEECSGKAYDVYIVADKSVSIGIEELDVEWEIIKRIYNSLEIAPGKTRVGLISYAKKAKTEFGLSKFSSAAAMNKKTFLKRTGTDAGTNTYTALQLLKENFAKEGYAGRQKIAVVITDGRSTTPNMTIQAANKIHYDTDIKVIAVGVGGKADEAELRTIATGYGDENVISANSFPGLLKHFTAVTKTVCNDEVFPRMTTPAYSTTTESEIGEIVQTTTMLPEVGVLPTNPMEECLNKELDVYLVVDKSKSISDNELKLEKFIMKYIINSFDVAPTKTRIGLFSYHWEVDHEFSLSEHALVDDLNSLDILPRPVKAAGTLTGRALMNVTKAFETEMAAGRQQVGILITDGRATDPIMTMRWAEKISRTDIIMFVVVVGTQPYENEVRAIATGPLESNIIRTAFPDILKDTPTIPKIVCSQF